MVKTFFPFLLTTLFCSAVCIRRMNFSFQLSFLLADGGLTTLLLACLPLGGVVFCSSRHADIGLQVLLRERLVFIRLKLYFLFPLIIDARGGLEALAFEALPSPSAGRASISSVIVFEISGFATTFGQGLNLGMMSVVNRGSLGWAGANRLTNISRLYCFKIWDLFSLRIWTLQSSKELCSV